MFGIVISTILLASLRAGGAQSIISNGVGGGIRLQRTYGGYPVYPGYLGFPGYPGFPAYPGYPGYSGYYNHQLGNGIYGVGPLIQGSPGHNFGLELAGGYGNGYYGGYNGLFGGFDGGFNKAYGLGPKQVVGSLPNTMNGFLPGIVPGTGYGPLVVPTVKKVFNQVF